MAIGAGNIARARQVAWIGGSASALILGAVGLVFAIAPWLWADLFTNDPGVLASADSYFSWVGPAYAFFGLGLCLYFSAQGAGKVLGPVLAGTARLLIIAIGGWWLSGDAPEWAVFALIAVGMVAYGLLTVISIACSKWGALTTSGRPAAEAPVGPASVSVTLGNRNSSGSSGRAG
jgi:Na+-driven multidrug efflux pump